MASLSVLQCTDILRGTCNLMGEISEWEAFELDYCLVRNDKRSLAFAGLCVRVALKTILCCVLPDIYSPSVSFLKRVSNSHELKFYQLARDLTIQRPVTVVISRHTGCSCKSSVLF